MVCMAARCRLPPELNWRAPNSLSLPKVATVTCMAKEEIIFYMPSAEILISQTSAPLNPIAIAIAQNASFVARAFSLNINGLKELLKAAIQHEGYALIDIFQPCVVFNRINTYQWFKTRVPDKRFAANAPLFGHISLFIACAGNPRGRRLKGSERPLPLRIPRRNVPRGKPHGFIHKFIMISILEALPKRWRNRAFAEYRPT